MVRAAAGSWWVLILFFVVFGFVLVRIGCMGADKRTADQTGAVFTAIVALMLLILAGLGFAGGAEGAEGGGTRAILELVLAIAFGSIAFLGWRDTSAASGAH